MSNLNQYQNKLTPNLVTKLKLLQDKTGGDFYIVSGYRSPEYNKKVGGKPNSQHMYGRAVDISRASFSQKPEAFKEIALELGFTGVGFYDDFIHVDVRPNPHSRGYSFWDNRTGDGKYDGTVIPDKPKKETPKVTDTTGLELPDNLKIKEVEQLKSFLLEKSSSNVEAIGIAVLVIFALAGIKLAKNKE